jgi:large repetitive protein
MRTTTEPGYRRQLFRFAPRLIVLLVGVLLTLQPAHAAVTVTASGPGGVRSQTLPDAGGPFDLNLPLTKNAVNSITVTASDSGGRSVSKELKVTQLSLDQLVVSQVTAQRMTKEEIAQAVSDGIIALDNPANYNISKFDIVLTIGTKPVSVSVVVPTPIAEDVTGFEEFKMPDADNAGGNPPPAPTEVIVFDQPVPAQPGQSAPPSIPGVIIIEGNIKSLKEFYTVRLLLMNTSGIFTLKEVVSSISFPDGGLSTIAPADGVISFGDILPGDGGLPGQAERQFIIRGDQIGVRPVRVSFGGRVAGPGIAEDKQIPFNGAAQTKVEVKGPPSFRVRAIHPDSVEAGVPYEFKVEITNTGDIAALYSSLDLSVGADGKLVSCDAATPPSCTPVGDTETRSFGDINPGQSVSALFTIMPLRTGSITSCLALADQNIALQVLVGTLGCLVGQVPPERGVPDGVPTVQVVPAPNLQGVGIDSPVAAFFSQKMNEASISTGDGGSFKVFDQANNLVPGVLRFETLNAKTVVIWQVQDNISNRLAPNAEYTVMLTKGIANLEGVPIYSAWTSRFSTTGMALDDVTPPTLTLAVDPPVNPSYVLPGQLVKVDAYAADQGSGVVRVELRIKDLSVTDAAYQLVDRKVVFAGDKPPFIFTIDSAKLAAGHSYQLLATAYDYMMNGQNATINLLIAASAAAPTITLPAAPVLGIPQGISVVLTPESLTGGVNEVRYYLDGSATPCRSVTVPPYQMTLGTLNLALGSHRIRALALDALGQGGEASYDFTLVVNPNKPQITLAGTVNGATYLVGSSFVVSGSASDPVGIALLSYTLDGTPIASGDQPFSVATASLSTGVNHVIVAQAVNAIGVSNTLSSSFYVAPLPNGPPPPAPTLTLSYPVNGVVSATGSSAPGARIDLNNLTQKLGISINAGAGGSFSGSLAAASGDQISAVAYDYATSQQSSPAASVTVPTPPVLTGIVAQPGSMSFNAINAWQDITVTGNYADATSANLTGKASFSSSDPAVAAVNASGRVVALKSGSAVITASVSGFSSQIAVTVDIVTLTSISVSPASLQFTTPGEQRQLSVTGHYSNGTSQQLGGVSYACGDLAVVQVTAGGLVTAVGNGLSQVTAFYPGVDPVAVPVAVNTALDTIPQVQILNLTPGAQVQRGGLVTIAVRATDQVGGVVRITLAALASNGASVAAESRTVSPAALEANASFSFNVPDSLAPGSSIAVSVTAEDTGHQVAQAATAQLTLVDSTAPTVSIVSPAAGTAYNYGDSITVTINASDGVGVNRIRFEATDAVTGSGFRNIVPAQTNASASFSFSIPFGTPSAQLRLIGYARDEAGNEGASLPIDLIVTNADLTPPATRVSAVADPGGSAATTLSYQVTDGLTDLDHVELYFRRNGIGSFNRYTDADHANADGKYLPQNGAAGTISFDSTKMGGDGSYEFYTVGIDKAGNREAAPRNTHAPADYPGLIAYYPFKGSAADASGNGNQGTLYGGQFVADRYGDAGAALSLNGSGNYVGIGSPVPAPLQVQNELTLMAWIYLTQYPSSGTLGTIVGCQRDSGLNNGYAIHVDGRTNPDGQSAPSGHLHFQIGNGGWHASNANAQLPLNQWVHVAAARKASEPARIYYNGVLQPSTSVNWDGAIGYGGAEYDLGRQSDYGDRYFGGTLDDVQVYGRALTAAEIAELAQLGTSDQSVTFHAGTDWTVIASPATAGEGDTSYDNRNIRVTGTSFTVNGVHSFKNLELVNGALLTHAPATAASFTKLDISAWSISVDATSAISSDAKGYLGGRAWHEFGRTQGNAYGSQDGAGGSYGGLGGSYSGRIPVPVYGYLTDPQDLGSGGGNWSGFAGGDGGGLIKLNAINVASDGSISSNGGASAGSAAGAGSGGGINIVTATISGRGNICAHGAGGSGTGAGGGRIAVRSADLSTLNQEAVKALGGIGNYGTGANGTVVFIQQNRAELVLTGQGPASPWIDLTIPQGYIFDSVTFRNYARVVAHDVFAVTGKVTVTGNSILTHDAQNPNGLVINAQVVQVDEGSAIDVTGRGYPGGKSWHEYGRTLGNAYGAADGAGGSYGGVGSGYQGRGSGPIYGDPKNPVYLGSGGGNWSGIAGGDGGGRITINAEQAIVVNGSVSANGGASGGSAAGNGSGGSILLRTSKLSGSGSITAHGGGEGNGVGGGGGRIAIYCDYVDPAGNLANLYNIAAFGKTGAYDTRQTTPGTVFIKYGNQSSGNLYLDAGLTDAQGAPNRAATDSIVFTPLGFGTTQSASADTLVGDGLTTFYPDSLPGVRLNPDLQQGESFVILSNTATSITVQTPNENGKDFASLAAAGKTYGGYYRFDNVVFRRGGNLKLGDTLEVTDTLSLSEYGTLTHYDATPTFISWLDLRVKHLVIASTGSIDATGRGYLGGRAWHEQGRTLGNAYGALDGAGGSYGGVATGYQGRASNPPYGSPSDPIYLGSGGGNWSGVQGGDGGGLLLVRAESILLDGAIIANGGESGGSAAGDGSGGSVNITTVDLSGTGSIQAKGGGNGDGSGAGGGRIAVKYSGTLSLPEQNITAIGGTGNYGSPGGNGTVFLNRQGEPNGDLLVDGFNIPTPADSTRIPGGYTFKNLILRNAARVVADDGITVTGKLLITGNSVLTHGPVKEAGLVVSAGTIQVDQGSSIDVSSRGHQGGREWHEQGRTLGNIYGSADGAGGSYGGQGGGYQQRSSFLVYGDAKNPTLLGSGGGNWSGCTGGDGGGRITLTATQEVVINGTVAANGGSTCSAGGDGSGGSILIQAPLISGQGWITADGGGGGSGVAGGGGRVALYCDAISAQDNLNGLRNVTAFSGRGNYDDRKGTAGTVYLKFNGGEGHLFIDDNVVDGNGVANGTAVESTPLTLIGFGTAQTVSGNTLGTDGAVQLVPGGAVGLRLNPDTAQQETFVIQANTANSITVLSPNEDGVHFTDLAGVGKTYSGNYVFDNIATRRGGSLVLADPLQVANGLSIDEYGMLTHYPASATFASKLILKVKSLTVGSTARIDVSGRGYPGGRGWYENGRTLGFAYGATSGAGGSYGGLGGGYQGNLANPVYGSMIDSVDLGSGGGAWGNSWGGNGGGAVLIDAAHILLDGLITANGTTSDGSPAGDGSGGTVNISTVDISGAGQIQANGAGRGSGGGGGRISLLHTGISLLPDSNLAAHGGIGNYATGADGSVYAP